MGDIFLFAFGIASITIGLSVVVCNWWIDHE